MTINNLVSYLNDELKYRLSEPIIATQNRLAPSSRIKNGLLHINGSRCPKCLKSFFNDFQDDIFVSGRGEQVAHIYGRRNFDNVEHGGNRFHVENEEQLDKYNNYIYLCSDCHREYDLLPSYLNYLKMLKLKKDLVENASERDKIYYFLDGVKDEFSNVMNNYNRDNLINFSVTVKQDIENKLEYNLIDENKSEKIIEDIIKYYVHIDNYFTDSENNEILIRIIKMYNREKNNFDDKNNVLNFILANLITEFKYEISDNIINAIISFLIMKCEVLENDSTE